MEAEAQVVSTTTNNNNNNNTNLNNNNNNNTKTEVNRRIRKSPEFQAGVGGGNNNNNNNNMLPGVLTRERSFVRTSNQQNMNKRRSLAFNIPNGPSNHVQMRGKPTMDIYRPPKLNYNLQHSSSSSMVFPTASSPTGMMPQGKNFHQQMQYVAASNAMAHRRQAGLSLGSMPLKAQHMGPQHRPIIMSHSHPLQINAMATQVPIMNSNSGAAILQAPTRVVKFAPTPQSHKSGAGMSQQQLHIMSTHNGITHAHMQQQLHHGQAMNAYNNSNIIAGGASDPYMNSLQRSKSLSSADALTRGFANLGLALGADVNDIGQFSPEIQSIIDAALEDPNKLNSRSLMELTSHFIKRAVEGRRYALPISRLCLNIIAKEQKETFLEALLNTCRQWYQEREKLLFTIHGMKSPSRVRFTAFMAFLTEMFCQLKRRQLQLRTQCEGAPPPLVLLTLLTKCCEDCVKPPVRSLSEIECLFYVLTCIGQDMEQQLPQQLELILAFVRDAFLNASDAPPAIRRTLLQLIELQASHWQLPGNTVLYYYPSAK